MARNRLLPTHIFAILMMGIALFMLVIAWLLQQSIASGLAYSDEPDAELIWLRNVFALAGTSMMVFSIGLLMLKKWAIQGFIGLFWLLGIVWLGLLWYISRQAAGDPTHWPIALAGLTVLIYTFLAVGILFLSSSNILAVIYGKEAAEENTQNILDQP
ncbi:MAG: hypothetical protein HUU01_07345 [Saprospiraceae bacterium]|nr:hypothetical protein [Saprospiraceae bacterium]